MVALVGPTPGSPGPSSTDRASRARQGGARQVASRSRAGNSSVLVLLYYSYSLPEPRRRRVAGSCGKFLTKLVGPRGAMVTKIPSSSGRFTFEPPRRWLASGFALSLPCEGSGIGRFSRARVCMGKAREEGLRSLIEGWMIVIAIIAVIAAIAIPGLPVEHARRQRTQRGGRRSRPSRTAEADFRANDATGTT